MTHDEISTFVKILFNFKQKILAWIKVNLLKTLLILPKAKNLNLLATSSHFKNLISPKPTWNSQLSLRDCQQITFVMLNGLFLLSKNPPTSLFLTDNIKMNRIAAKIKWKYITTFLHCISKFGGTLYKNLQDTATRSFISFCFY